jgi:hypothetical protein
MKKVRKQVYSETMPNLTIRQEFSNEVMYVTQLLGTLFVVFMEMM